jgi:hypothetical protein
MRMVAPAKRAVDEMFDVLPLIDIKMKMPLVCPASLMREMPVEAPVYDILVNLLCLIGAYESLVGRKRMAMLFDQILPEIATEDRLSYTITLVLTINKLALLMLSLKAEYDILDMEPGGYELERRGPTYGPAWDSSLVNFIR